MKTGVLSLLEVPDGLPHGAHQVSFHLGVDEGRSQTYWATANQRITEYCLIGVCEISLEHPEIDAFQNVRVGWSDKDSE